MAKNTVPSTGPIKVSDINTALGNTSTTEAEFSGSTSTPASGTLFGDGNISDGLVNKTAPHKLSEWRGYCEDHLCHESGASSISGGTGFEAYAQRVLFQQTVRGDEEYDTYSYWRANKNKVSNGGRIVVQNRTTGTSISSFRIAQSASISGPWTNISSVGTYQGYAVAEFVELQGDTDTVYFRVEITKNSGSAGTNYTADMSIWLELCAYVVDFDETNDFTICSVTNGIASTWPTGMGDLNTNLTEADMNRIINGTTGVEMDYNFAADVEGSADNFGVVFWKGENSSGGTRYQRRVRVNDDNEITSVYTCP